MKTVMVLNQKNLSLRIYLIEEKFEKILIGYKKSIKGRKMLN